MSTADRLVTAAAELLDSGGESAVTLRAVGAAVGMSHNAPYKHFHNREDLLAAVATADFNAVAATWAQLRASQREPLERLLGALEVMITFSVEHPARYRLLFNNPSIAAQGGPLTHAAHRALDEFALVVETCQAEGVLPNTPSSTLAVIIFATLHGLLDADASGRLRPRTGWNSVLTGMRAFIELLG
jgi:AcrR family transcriptional regulator